MLPKYKIEFSVPFQSHVHRSHHETDDPVACEDFVSQLLEKGFPISEIKHEGVALSRHDFDRMIKAAANLLASRHICASLHIKTEEERFRFGFAA
jgi:hypothetical protein